MAQLARVQVANPATPKRAKRRAAKGNSMAAKKRRKRKSTTKKRAHARRRRSNPVRAVAANPKRRSHKRRRRSNPRRRSHRAPLFARRAHAAPKSHRRRRARRHNGIPAWALAGIAAAVGLAGYAVGQAGSFAITQRTQDGKRENLDRNRYIAFGALTAAGLGLAAFVKGPTVQMIGAGLAAGGLVGLAGTELSLALSGVIDAKDAKGNTIPLAGVYDVPQFAGVYDGGRQQFAGVDDADGTAFSGNNGQQFAGVYDDGAQQFGYAG